MRMNYVSFIKSRFYWVALPVSLELCLALLMTPKSLLFHTKKRSASSHTLTRIEMHTQWAIVECEEKKSWAMYWCLFDWDSIRLIRQHQFISILFTIHQFVCWLSACANHFFVVHLMNPSRLKAYMYWLPNGCMSCGKGEHNERCRNKGEANANWDAKKGRKQKKLLLYWFDSRFDAFHWLQNCFDNIKWCSET